MHQLDIMIESAIADPVVVRMIRMMEHYSRLCNAALTASGNFLTSAVRLLTVPFKQKASGDCVHLRMRIAGCRTSGGAAT